MKIKDYILSKLPYLIMNLSIYLLLAVILRVADMPLIILFLILLIWFIPLIVYMILEYINERKFYGDIINVMEKLDKKYLLSEIIKKPNYYEGRIFYDALKEAHRNMHEEVNFYKHLQSEYREYVETWVHEIKTPIASSKLILENSDIKEKAALIDEINRVDQYITQALYYSRSTDVSKDYIVREFNLEDIINECIRDNRRAFINKRMAVNIENVDLKVVSDQKWIKFIINQIIINSIKYSKKENGYINIYLLEKDSNRFSLVIEDNGIGIPKSDINRVFDKGFTGENGRIYGKSTGIGLYLCKKLCNKLNLEINLKSEVNSGTTVIINF
ncbi:MAG: sensor histidine kinase [Clostridium butyricum]|nr:sensor histidine kinase [Clostridium butyricum]